MRITHRRRSLRFFCLVMLTLCLCLFQPFLSLSQRAVAQPNDISDLVQQGIEAYQEYRYADAINHWHSALAALSDESADRAIIHENLARAYHQLGQPTQALGHWQSATATYTTLQDAIGVGRTLTEQAQTYSSLGQPFQAVGLLCGSDAVQSVSRSTRANRSELPQCSPGSAIELTQRLPDSALAIAAWGSLGEVYRSLQVYPLALQALRTGLALAEVSENIPTQALLHNSLGHTYREQAELNYQRAATSRRSGSGDEKIFEDRAQMAGEKALGQFQTSLSLAQPLPAVQVKALLGLIAVYGHKGDQANIDVLQVQARDLMSQLSPSQGSAYLMLQLAKRRLPLATPEGQALTTASYQSSRSLCQDISLNANTLSLLQQASALAETLGNNRLKAFASGEIGHYYECSGDYSTALEVTREARLAASGDLVIALDTLYLWQWQTGRIHAALGEMQEATSFYSQAAENLDQLRDEILASNQTLQFDFRDAVAPVYRELAEIQLAQVPEITLGIALKSEVGSGSLAKSDFGGRVVGDVADRDGAFGDSAAISQTTAQNDTQMMAAQANIRNALGIIDSLQLAELQNYFGSDCVVPVGDQRLDEVLTQATASGEAVDADTALISTIIFPQRTAVILTLPNQLARVHFIEVVENDFREQILDFRDSLEDVKSARLNYNTRLSEDLYQELIAPFEGDLDASNIRTLLFVHDGILRNVPMAALYDGEQYLIERFAIAIAPSLQIPQIGTRETVPLRALVLGLSEVSKVDSNSLNALPAVKEEAADVARLLPGSEILLNEALTKEQVTQTVQANAYSVFHIATHGQFGTDPQNTFLVMGRQDDDDEDRDGITEENQLLRLGELDALIRAGVPRAGLLELISLSACQTASGDERSSLGLAGITIRAGAKSALASLWSVEDEATADLMIDFYENWTAGTSKAQALRAAQLDLLRSDQNKDHPYYWSAFVLAGDWQA